MRKATPEKKRYILANKHRRTRRDLARETGLSLGTVQGILAEAEAKDRKRRPVAPPAPAVATPATDDSCPLSRAVDLAEDDREVARRLRDFVAYHEPEIGAALAGGTRLVQALVESPHTHALGCIREPADLADFVALVTREPDSLPYEVTPTKAEWAAIRKAEHERAVELLEATLAIFRAETP